MYPTMASSLTLFKVEVDSITGASWCLPSTFFFLEYAGELCIIVLIVEKMLT